MLSKDNLTKGKSVKIPLYVHVYEKISGWIKDGTYKPGDKLPGENILAEQLKVSRGTLRQAMLLLQEDGLVGNHQGKANVVLSNKDLSKIGLEKIGNPIVDFCTTSIDRIETTIGFQPPTKKHQEVLKLRPSELVAVVDIVYYSQENPVGFAMAYMPYDNLAQSNVDFDNTDTVYEFYKNVLISPGLYSDTKIRMGSARERTANILHINEDDCLMIMEEVLYSQYDIPVLSQKLFYSPDCHEISIRRENDRSKSKI